MSKALITESLLTDIADAIIEKGGSSGPLRPTEMAAAIMSITSGGSTAIEESDVNFYDYDGTLLYSYTASQAQALQEMPENPTHDGLTSQGWNYTLTEVKDEVERNGICDIGQMYLTSDEATYIYCNFQMPNPSPVLSVNLDGTIVIDWGDSSATNTLTGTSNEKVSMQHTYQSSGNYVIKISVTSGTFTICNDESNYSACSCILSSGFIEDYAETEIYLLSINKVLVGSNVLIGSYAFGGCRSLESITLPYDTNLGFGSDVFRNCSQLKCVIAPKGSYNTIGSQYFYYCKNLKTISIPRNVQNLSEYQLDGCDSLKRLALPYGITNIGNYVAEISGIEDIKIPDSVTNIGYGAFSHCIFLMSANIPGSIDVSNDGLGDEIFSSCMSLKNITLDSNLMAVGTRTFCYSGIENVTIPSAVTALDNYAFAYCKYLKNVNIPNSVTNIGDSTFQECLSLSSITLPNNLTTIGSYAFSDCSRLQSITIPNTVTSIAGYTFRNCNALTSIDIPSGITTLPVGMFSYCSALESVTLPSGLTKISNEAFYECTNLSNITIPDSVTSIGTAAFSGNQVLETLQLPSGLKSIPMSMFYGSTGLKRLTIPSNVTYIWSKAFYDCTGMEEYHLLSTTPPTLNNISAFNGIPQNCKIYVPSSSDHSILNAYKTATNWATYASYIVEEPTG